MDDKNFALNFLNGFLSKNDKVYFLNMDAASAAIYANQKELSNANRSCKTMQEPREAVSPDGLANLYAPQTVFHLKKLVRRWSGVRD